MPSNPSEWMKRVKAVEREHTATQFATENLLDVVHRDPTALQGDLRVKDLRVASDRLEGTYIIRLFAEFETILRMFWQASRGKDSPSRTRDLLDGVGAKRKVPHDRIQNAHEVRKYRNLLVHEREEEIEPIPIGQARGHLCRFLSFLPFQW